MDRLSGPIPRPDERQAMHWILLTLALLFTLYVLIELWSGVTGYRYRRGFMDTEEITVSRRESPLMYWSRMGWRFLGLVCIWLAWYASYLPAE